MTLHLALAGEAVRDDIYPVVSLSALPRAGMAFVPIRLVENLERDRRQACGQARFDPLLHGHSGHSSLFATRGLARRTRRVVSNRGGCRLSVTGRYPHGDIIAHASNTRLPSSKSAPKVSVMDLNSPLFDRIRVKWSRKNVPAPAAAAAICSHPGCQAEGVFKAPKGRDREGEYFCFCKDHVREYNATYDYFKGMDDDALARYRSAEAIGHRPTWKMGPRGGAHGAPHVDETVYAEARTMRRKGARRTGDAAQAPRYNALALKALHTMDLDAKATESSIKARYKDLVKRHHPDANGGDRSSEEKLREIIKAYNFLRSQKLV